MTSIYDQINGRVTTYTKTMVDGSSEIETRWVGGDIIGVTKHLIEAANPEFIEWLAPGRYLRIDQFKVEVIGEDSNMYLCQRVKP